MTSVEATGEWNDDVSRILTENGISVGKLVWEFDGDEVERQLLELDGVAFASVSKRGTRVYVDVRTELDGEDFVDIGTQPVKATVRATVTRTVVFSGSALVEYGDVVNVGDELIGAYVTVGEEKVACPADGEVYGKTYRTHTKFSPTPKTLRCAAERNRIRGFLSSRKYLRRLLRRLPITCWKLRCGATTFFSGIRNTRSRFTS